MQSFNRLFSPKVSVLMVTYNHERYIRQAVESVLEQETDFPIELVVGEDCSTDRTRDYLIEYQKSHPETLRLLLREKNIGPQANFAATFAACRGTFVALLEGDDYWTDSKKLQKQVDALEANPHWSICFHTTRRVYEDGSQEPELYPANWTREEATIDDLFTGNFMNTCSVVFRNRLFGPMPEWHLEIMPGDWATSMLNADHGPIGYVPGVMADYRIHPQGVWGRKSRTYQLTEIFRFLSRIDNHFKGKYRKQIDAYRTNLIASLILEIDGLRLQPAKPSASEPTSEPVAVETEPMVAHSVVMQPLAKSRSPAGKVIRNIMRPIERVLRKGRCAFGLAGGGFSKD